jgi:hypothetical protein
MATESNYTGAMYEPNRQGSVLGLGVVVGLAVGIGALVAYGVPGYVLQCLLFVAVPAAIVERLGLGLALWRSVKLTEDYRLTIFGALFAIAVAGILVGGAASLAFRHGRAWTPELRQTARTIM